MPKGSGLSLADFRQYNREQLLDWLAAHAGGWGTLGRGGQGIRRIEKRRKPGPGVPLSGEMLDGLDDPDIRATDEIMRRVVSGLDSEQPLLHTLLTPVYFAADASPARAEEWRRRALDGDSEQYARLYGNYLAAGGWMLGKAEELLEEAGRKRLVAPGPYPEELETVRPKRLQSEARRRQARDLYYAFLEGLGGEREAWSRTAAATGYRENTVRRIVKR